MMSRLLARFRVWRGNPCRWGHELADLETEHSWRVHTVQCLRCPVRFTTILD